MELFINEVFSFLIIVIAVLLLALLTIFLEKKYKNK